MKRVFFVTFPDGIEEPEIEEFRASVEENGGKCEERARDDREDASDDLLDDVLGSLYAAIGDTEAMIVKSSAEIAFEIEDMVAASVASVAKWLKSNRFATKVVGNTVCWILYEKNVSY